VADESEEEGEEELATNTRPKDNSSLEDGENPER
jgi:hypothetical protein